MLKTVVFDALNRPNQLEKEELVGFLFENLDEYGDPKEDIRNAIDYAVKEVTSFGGTCIMLRNDLHIEGAVVVNKTGMKGYIPDNILVYIAVHKNARGKGMGKSLMNKVLELVKGDIALHVEKDNPAIHLYEKFGFTNPYNEMRLKRS